MFYVDYWDVSEDYQQKKIIGKFKQEKDAQQFSKGHGIDGGNGYVFHRGFWVAETLGDHLRITELKEKEIALNKLTNKEQRLLGLIR